MTNQELYEKIKSEIPHFQIGFHQISLYKYFDVVERGGARAIDFKIAGENITEQDVARRILHKGFQVWDRRLGLPSTSFFPREVSQGSFNYKYYSKDLRVCNIIFALPYYLHYGRKDYFIGDLSMSLSFGNRLFFNDGIIPEFIYGYFDKETPITYNPFPEYHFSEELEFHSNDKFWLNLSPEEQKEVLNRLFSEKKEAFRKLRLVNNHSQLQLLCCDSLDRFIIRKTREQKKVYMKKRIPNDFS